METSPRTPSLPPQQDDIRRQLHETLDELAAIRDELRVRAHLASMEARQELERVDQRFDELRDRAAHAKGDALDAIASGLAEVHATLKQVRARIEGAGRS
jgi:uncharacterized coiled-coil DUF342 family protein